MGNNKKSIQFFLYTLFYVSRVTNLTTPRSAPEFHYNMSPRARRGGRLIREVERNLLHNMYIRNGALWDVVINEVVRDKQFEQLPRDVRQLYENASKTLYVEEFVTLWGESKDSN